MGRQNRVGNLIVGSGILIPMLLSVNRRVVCAFPVVTEVLVSSFVGAESPTVPVALLVWPLHCNEAVFAERDLHGVNVSVCGQLRAPFERGLEAEDPEIQLAGLTVVVRRWQTNRPREDGVFVTFETELQVGNGAFRPISCEPAEAMDFDGRAFCHQWFVFGHGDKC